jgi:simple sugar transport system permease protein
MWHAVTRFLLRRPEVGPAIGALAAWSFFAVSAGDRGFLTTRSTASYLEIWAQLAILAIFVALLMIAGEFDLSIGSTIGLVSMVVALMLTEYQAPPTVVVLVAMAIAVTIGLVNGFIVVKTRLPSFIVTLAMLFIVRGLTIGLTRAITSGVQVGGVRDEAGWVETVFAADVNGFSISILLALVLGAGAAVVLSQTRFGNWIFAVGGDEESARRAGVPTRTVKVSLFVGTSCAAALVALIQVMEVGSANVLRGQLEEFEAIAAAVIGGTLLTGGYGSVVGVLLGAFIFAVIEQGIFFTGIDADWYRVALGVMLLGAVFVNHLIREYAFRRV